METHRQTPPAPETRADRLRSPDDWVKLLAFALMLTDHVGWLLLPEVSWLRWVGRLSMPIFAYLIAAGFSRTRSPLRYAGRLLAVGAISQAVVWWVSPAAGSSSLNIFFTLAAGVGWLAWRREDAWTAWAFLGTLVLGSLLLGGDLLGFVSYGVYGLVSVALADAFLVRPGRPWMPWLGVFLFSAASATAALRLGYGGHQELAGFAWLVVLALAWRPRPRMALEGGRAWYLFYPGHLLALGLIARLLGIPAP